MTNRPVPPSRPVLSSRARAVRLPGLSLEYQLRISRTRSVMTLSPSENRRRTALGAWAYHAENRTASAPRTGASPASAAPPATIGPPTMLPLAPHGIPHGIERRLVHPAQLGGIELRIAVDAAVTVTLRIERDVGEHLAAARPAACDREGVVIHTAHVEAPLRARLTPRLH